MKKLLHILSILIIISCSKEIQLDQLLERNGLSYEINNKKPFTGSTLSYHPNGQLESRIEYKDGLKVGMSEIFYENGQILIIENYKDGQFEGLVESFYEDGSINERSNYKNGIIDGAFESYYKNGQLRSKGVIKDGSFIGEYHAYTFSGEKTHPAIDKIMDEWVAIEINTIKNNTCEYTLDYFDIEFFNSPFDDKFVDGFTEFVRGTDLKNELADIYETYGTYEELETYVNFYLNRYKFSDYHWKKSLQIISEEQIETIERCNGSENLISALNTFHINRDKLFDNIFKPNEVNLINAENDVKQQIDEFLGYAVGINIVEECKEFQGCVKVFKVIYD